VESVTIEAGSSGALGDHNKRHRHLYCERTSWGSDCRGASSKMRVLRSAQSDSSYLSRVSVGRYGGARRTTAQTRGMAEPVLAGRICWTTGVVGVSVT